MHFKNYSFSYLSTLFFGLMMAASTGCGPSLSVEKTIDVDQGEIRTILVAPVGREQTVKVEASSSVRFKCHIHLAGDEEEVDQAVMAGKESPKILASDSDVTSTKLEALVPADKEAAIRFQGAGSKSAKIKYSISN